jgi:PilZ domain
MEKRQHPRIAMKNLFAYINDGKILTHGTIIDISRNGLALTDLSKRLQMHAKKLTVVVSGEKVDFKMTIRPRWFVQGGVKKTIGAQIITTPEGWMEFVMDKEPVINNNPPSEIFI